MEFVEIKDRNFEVRAYNTGGRGMEMRAVSVCREYREAWKKYRSGKMLTGSETDAVKKIRKLREVKNALDECIERQGVEKWG